MSNQTNQERLAEVAPGLMQAVERTLYHYPGVTPTMAAMFLLREFPEAPPLPTEEEKKQAIKIVKKILQSFKTSMRARRYSK